MVKSCFWSSLILFRTYPNEFLHAVKLSIFCRPHLVEIYQLNLLDLSSKPLDNKKVFDLIQTLVLPSHKSVKGINTTERLLILSSSSDAQIEIVKWDESYNEQVLNPQRPVFKLNTEDLEALVCLL